MSEHASDWIRQFVKHLELNFVDSSHGLPSDANISEFHDATVRAMFQTLLDSGMDTESIVETIGQILVAGRTTSAKWSAELNQRRFELIDKEIQATLTPAERIELAIDQNYARTT